MTAHKLRIFLTGLPASGKTTVVMDTIKRLDTAGIELIGFYTQQINQAERSGFQVASLDGTRVPFAHINLKRGPRVGPYRVDVEAFEAVVLPQLIKAERSAESGSHALFVVDEVGKMECLSQAFVQKLGQLMRSPVCMLMTVACRGTGFIKRVRDLAGENLLEVTPYNRDILPSILFNTVTSYFEDDDLH